MSIDWDEVLQEAEDSPRGLLSEVLQRADDIEQVVIVFVDKDGVSNTWEYTGSSYHTIAMLSFGHWRACQVVRENAEEEP